MPFPLENYPKTFKIGIVSLVLVAYMLNSCEYDSDKDQAGVLAFTTTNEIQNSIIHTEFPTPRSIVATLPSIFEILPTPPVKHPNRIPTTTPMPFYSGPMIIGTSAGGRSIFIHRFGTGSRQRMIIAGIHGGFEWNTIKLANQLIEVIQQNPHLVPSDITLYLLPSLNPDGVALGHGPLGRSNDHGVDLNRNFPTNWQIDWPRSGCWQMGSITAGLEPLSEPESSVLAQFIKTHSIDALISYHSAGMGIYPGENPTQSQSENLAKTLAVVSGYQFPPFDTGCIYTGTLVDFAAANRIAAVDVELLTRWDPEIDVNMKILSAFLSWTADFSSSLPLPDH